MVIQAALFILNHNYWVVHILAAFSIKYRSCLLKLIYICGHFLTQCRQLSLWPLLRKNFIPLCIFLELNTHLDFLRIKPLQKLCTIKTCSTLDQNRSWPDQKTFKDRKYTAKVGQDNVNIGVVTHLEANSARSFQVFKGFKYRIYIYFLKIIFFLNVVNFQPVTNLQKRSYS